MTFIVTVIVVSLLVAFALGLYVAVALGMTAMTVGLVFIDKPIWGFFAHIPWAAASNVNIAVVPLFLLMGELLLRSGATETIYDTLSKWLNRLPGGLLHTNIGACGVFSAISGSSVATAVTISAVSLPSMRAYGYHEGLALGTLAAGGTLGIMIPPSIVLIVYGLLAEVSIGKLYIAGILPGLLMMGLFMAVIFVFAKVRPEMAPQPDAATVTWVDRIRSLFNLLPVFALIFLVLGTIYLGIATAMEAAAFGVCGAFVYALANRRVNLRMLKACFLGAASTTAMGLLILICSFLLQNLLANLGLPGMLSRWVIDLGLSPLELILVLCVFYLILGMMMEGFAMLVTTLPIVAPMLIALDVDMVWFGIVMVIMIELAMITPPVGMNLFVLQGVRMRDPNAKRGRGILDIYVGALPFVVAMLVCLALIIAFPQIAVWLVSTADFNVSRG